MPYADPEKRKQFNRDYQRAWYHRHKEKVAEYLSREDVKERTRVRIATARKKHPEKHRARNAVNNAIRYGKLKREACEVCGDPKSEAHHEDYEKPLVVKWLCRTHHDQLHGKTVTDAEKVMNGEAGKGDSYRPVNSQKWSEGYDRAFRSEPPAEAPEGDTALRDRRDGEDGIPLGSDGAGEGSSENSGGSRRPESLDAG